MEAAFAVGASAPVLLISTFGDSIGQGTNSIMSRYKTPNIQKPLEQYLINNNNYAKTPNPNNFIINKKINYLGESTLRHNPITCPIDDLEYNKYVINGLKKVYDNTEEKRYRDMKLNRSFSYSNNYSDYGFDYDSLNGTLDLDPTVLAGALAGALIPEFEGVFDLVYGAQPGIGLDFNATNNILDYLDLIEENQGGDLSVWEPPSYPAVNTSTYIPASVPNYETYALQTIPDEYIEGTGDWFFFGYDLIDSLGLLVFVIPLVILGLFWRFTGGD